MPRNLLARGASWLARQRDWHLASTVVYRRGVDTVSVRATQGESDFEEVDPDSGMLLRRSLTDFLLLASDLVIGGSTVEPERGDEIDAVYGDTTVTYEVRPPAGGEPVWSWSDQCRLTMRVHVKRISEAKA